MDIGNILSFGAKGRIKKHHDQYLVTYNVAKEEYDILLNERSKAIDKMNALILVRQDTMKSVNEIRGKYLQIVKDSDITVKLLKKALAKHRRNLLTLQMSNQEIAVYSIGSISCGVLIGITVATVSTGVGTIAGIGLAHTTTLGGATAIGSSVVTGSAATTAAGSVSWLTVGAIALPLSIAFMAGLSHWNANEKIKEINAAEAQLVLDIGNYRDLQNKCIGVQKRAAELTKDLGFLQQTFVVEFDKYFQVCRESVKGLSGWQKFFLKVCLFLGLPHDRLAHVRQEKKNIKELSGRIHDLITVAIA